MALYTFFESHQTFSFLLGILRCSISAINHLGKYTKINVKWKKCKIKIWMNWLGKFEKGEEF